MTILDGIPFAAAATIAGGDMALLDLCAVRLYGVFQRDWAPGGVAALPLAEGRDRLAEELTALERRHAVPLAVLRRGGDAFDPALLDLLDGFDLDRLHWVHLDAAGRLERGGVSLAAREQPGRRFTVAFQGRQRQHVDTEVLPLAVSVRTGAPQADTRLVGVEGGPSLPAPVWFQLPDPADGRLGLGILPGFDGDRWQMWLSGGERPRPAKPLVGIPLRPSAEAPFRLSLVFDRTAVDPAHWATAAGLRAAATAGGTFAVGGWNAGWRRAVSAFLSALPDDVEVDLWWFADLPGEGLDWPGIWPGPDRRIGNLGRFAPRQAAREVEALDWVPGLDVWDGLDLALAELSERVVATPTHRHGVLIVGNSPPPPSAHPSPAWTRLRDALGGGIRRLGRWEEYITSLAVRCGVACVQLPVGDGGATDAGLRHVQSLLREALEQDGVRVLPVAGPSAQAFEDAFGYLRTHVPSSVELTP